MTARKMCLNFPVTFICAYCLETALGSRKMHFHLFNDHARREVVENHKGRVEEEDPRESSGFGSV